MKDWVCGSHVKKAEKSLLPEMFLENQRTPHTSVYENNALHFEQMPTKKIRFQFSVQQVGPTDYSIINVHTIVCKWVVSNFHSHDSFWCLGRQPNHIAFSRIYR
jgi:hypothetical protein